MSSLISKYTEKFFLHWSSLKIICGQQWDYTCETVIKYIKCLSFEPIINTINQVMLMFPTQYIFICDCRIWSFEPCLRCVAECVRHSFNSFSANTWMSHTLQLATENSVIERKKTLINRIIIYIAGDSDRRRIEEIVFWNRLLDGLKTCESEAHAKTI